MEPRWVSTLLLLDAKDRRWQTLLLELERILELSRPEVEVLLYDLEWLLKVVVCLDYPKASRVFALMSPYLGVVDIEASIEIAYAISGNAVCPIVRAESNLFLRSHIDKLTMSSANSYYGRDYSLETAAVDELDRLIRAGEVDMRFALEQDLLTLAIRGDENAMPLIKIINEHKILNTIELLFYLSTIAIISRSSNVRHLAHNQIDELLAKIGGDLLNPYQVFAKKALEQWRPHKDRPPGW